MVENQQKELLDRHRFELKKINFFFGMLCYDING